MNVDTARLRLKVQERMARNQKRRTELQEEISKLEAEKPRLESALQTLEAVERVADEFEVFQPPQNEDSIWERLHRQEAFRPQTELPAAATAHLSESGDSTRSAPSYPEEAHPTDHDPFFVQWG